MAETTSVQPSAPRPRCSDKKKEQKNWTVMVYLAADNDLVNFAVESLKQMKAAMSANINIVAELDSGAEQATERYHFWKCRDHKFDDPKRNCEDDCKYDPLGSISCNVVESFEQRNAGNPKNLSDFIVWAVTNYRADHYFLIIWGHAAGIDDSFPRVPDENTLPEPEKDNFFIPRHRLLNVKNYPIADPPRKSLAFVDHPTSYLTNKGLRAALEDSLAELQSEQIDISKFDIIGMDACNMNLVELGYELRDQVNYMIASQDEVPDGSWPYYRILKELANELKRQLFELESADQQMEGKSNLDAISSGQKTQASSQTLNIPRFLCSLAKAYVNNYQDYVNQPVALSALDLIKSDNIRTLLGELAKSLKQHTKNRQVRDAIFHARGRVRSFYTRVLETRDLHTRDLYVDLIDFCELLKKYLDGHANQPHIGEYIDAICAVIDSFRLKCHKCDDPDYDPDSIIVANERSANEDNCNGTSIYFPANADDQFGSFYDDLDLSGHTGWVEFIKDFFKHNPIVPIPPGAITQTNDASTSVKGTRVNRTKGNILDASKGNRLDASKGNRLDASKGNILDASKFQTVENPSLQAMHYSQEANKACIHNVIYNYAMIVQTCPDDDDDDCPPTDSSGS